MSSGGTPAPTASANTDANTDAKHWSEEFAFCVARQQQQQQQQEWHMLWLREPPWWCRSEQDWKDLKRVEQVDKKNKISVANTNANTVANTNASAQPTPAPTAAQVLPPTPAPTAAQVLPPTPAPTAAQVLSSTPMPTIAEEVTGTDSHANTDANSIADEGGWAYLRYRGTELIYVIRS